MSRYGEACRVGRPTLEPLEARLLLSVTDPLSMPSPPAAAAQTELNDDPPSVVDVLVAGTVWDQAFLDLLAAKGLGDGGYSVPVGSAAQFDGLPWLDVDRVRIVFSEDVDVEQGDLAVYGVNVPEYAVSGFAYDGGSRTATWMLASPIGADTLLLALDDAVEDAGGRSLDGEWADGLGTYPSGDGTAGGDFLFRLNVLPGDVDQNGEVRSSDTIKVRRKSNTASGDSDYSCYHDVDGSGVIRSSDTIKIRRSANTELPPTGTMTVSEDGQNADVAMAGEGGFVVVWQQPDGDGDGIFVRRYGAGGGAIGAEIQVNTRTPGMQHDPAIATAPDGGFVVVWSSELAGSGAVRARLFDADGVPVSGELPITDEALANWGSPDVAADGEGNFVVVWNGQGVLGRRFDSTGAAMDEPIQLAAAVPSSYTWPHVAMNDAGSFVVSYPLSQYTGTAVATFDSEGRAISTGQVDTLWGTGLGINDDGLFVLSWVDDYPEQPVGDRYALYAQVYSILGHEVGGRVMVTPGKAGGLDWNIYDSDVAMDDDHFVVTWRDYDFPSEGSGHGDGIYAARFDMEGRRLEEEIEVGTYEQRWETYPSVAIGDAGRLVVAWQIGWGNGVLARPLRLTPAPRIQDPPTALALEGRFDFDGVDDYLSHDDPDLDLATYTLAFWFRADEPTASIQSLLARGEGAADKAQWIVQLNAEESPGRMQLWYENEAGTDSIFATTTHIAPDRWYHFAATRAADGTVSIYLDGALEHRRTEANVPVSIDYPVLLGARGNSPDRIQEFFDGTMAEIHVHTDQMSDYLVNRRMLCEVPDPGTGLVYGNDGPIELDGAGEYVEIPDSPELNTRAYTIALSFKADAPADGTQVLVARGEDWSDDVAQWVVELNDSSSPGRVQLWYEEADGTDHKFAAPVTVEADKWYHLVVSRSPEGRVAIYLDGKLELEAIDPVGPPKVDTPVLIGARFEGPDDVEEFFDGTIENVRIYNEALPHEEILDLVPPPRLTIDSPIDGAIVDSPAVELDVSFNRPLSEITYRLNGGPAVSMMESNWVYQEDPDAVSVWSGSAGNVTFDYLKPDWAVAARWRYSYATPAGTFTYTDDIPQAVWDRYGDKVVTQVMYQSIGRVYARAGTSLDLRYLGYNNPGGNGDNPGKLYDGDWGTGAAYHGGARQWLTFTFGGTQYVQFLEEAMLWDVRLVEDSVQRVLSAAPGPNTLTVTGTDTLGKTASVTVDFTVADAADLNGDFEAGTLGPWVLTDSGAVVTSDLFDPEIAPAGGTYMGYITTGRNELPSDLHFTDLDGDGVAEREYSSLAIDVVVSAAATVEVDLNFLTAEILPGGSFGESDLLGVTTGAITDTSAYKMLYAVAPSDSSYGGTATPLTAADFSDEYIEDNPFGTYPTIADRSVFYGQTGFRRYSFALEAGTHTLTFFVADSHTDGEATAMLIDNLTVTVGG